MVDQISSSGRMHIYVPYLHHIYDWNIVNCNTKQQINTLTQQSPPPPPIEKN